MVRRIDRVGGVLWRMASVLALVVLVQLSFGDLGAAPWRVRIAAQVDGGVPRLETRTEVTRAQRVLLWLIVERTGPRGRSELFSGFDGVVHRALAEGPCADDRRAAVLLHRGGEELRAGGRELVLQDDDGNGRPHHARRERPR